MTRSEALEVLADVNDLDPGEFRVERHDNYVRATSAGAVREVRVIPFSEGASISAFHRVAKKLTTGEQVRWLVAELNGVRAYIDTESGTIILSDKDIYP